MARQLVFNENLPDEIRRALVRKAKAENVRLYDAAGAVLAAHFGMEWQPNGPYKVESARIDKIKVPPALHTRIRKEALRIPSGTMRGVVLSVLADELGVNLEIPRTRRPRATRKEV